jgi:glycerophosphoryl diester phosphodiesterase
MSEDRGAVTVSDRPSTGFRRVGHKGADLIAPGNTIESFIAAVEAGVEMVEFDVLRTRDGQLIVAHDYEEAAARQPLRLTEVLDAFCDPPLDEIEFDCDLKLPGREGELAGAIVARDLLDRAMVSTMEQSSLRKLAGIEPDLRLGWTFPKTRRDWTRYGWARAGVRAGLAAMRRRMPALLIEKAPELGVDAVWLYHELVTERVVDAAESVDVELIAWTVDVPERIWDLVSLGVHGICTNDPRLFHHPPEAPGEDVETSKGAEKAPEDELSEDRAKPSWRERWRAKRDARATDREAKKAAKRADRAAKKESD